MKGALPDTHALLWWLGDDQRLSERTRDVISSGEVPVVFSAASIWEVAIKAATGRLRVAGDYVQALIDDGFAELPISARHADAAGRLPLLHRDPFDRLIVAQAQLEGLTVFSRDARLTAYDVDVRW